MTLKPLNEICNGAKLTYESETKRTSHLDRKTKKTLHHMKKT